MLHWQGVQLYVLLPYGIFHVSPRWMQRNGCIRPFTRVFFLSMPFSGEVCMTLRQDQDRYHFLRYQTALENP
jgi:hypothetical protein